MDALKVIITGATGMVGEGVLYECLHNPKIAEVLVLGRRSVAVQHEKLKEIVCENLYDLDSYEEQLKGYDACYYCLGITSLRISEAEYYKVTYTLTLSIAELLCRLNPQLIFCYISGAGTTSNENARIMWIRVKAKTENALLRLPFKKAYNLRPGFIKPTPGLRNAHSFYRYISWFYPIGRALQPNSFCTLREIGLAMINSSYYLTDKAILEGRDIIRIAKLA